MDVFTVECASECTDISYTYVMSDDDQSGLISEARGSHIGHMDIVGSYVLTFGVYKSHPFEYTYTQIYTIQNQFKCSHKSLKNICLCLIMGSFPSSGGKWKKEKKASVSPEIPQIWGNFFGQNLFFIGYFVFID